VVARRAGCWANALLAMALFFATGAVVSLFNGEIATVLQALIATFLLIAIAIWLARRRNG
jgi:ribose/xylose/arabinose/galactoside ABC-type transport system permease subunit